METEKPNPHQGLQKPTLRGFLCWGWVKHLIRAPVLVLKSLRTSPQTPFPIAGPYTSASFSRETAPGWNKSISDPFTASQRARPLLTKESLPSSSTCPQPGPRRCFTALPKEHAEGFLWNIPWDARRGSSQESNQTKRHRRVHTSPAETQQPQRRFQMLLKASQTLPFPSQGQTQQHGAAARPLCSHPWGSHRDHFPSCPIGIPQMLSPSPAAFLHKEKPLPLQHPSHLCPLKKTDAFLQSALCQPKPQQRTLHLPPQTRWGKAIWARGASQEKGKQRR